MEATGQTESLAPQPLDAEAGRRRQQLEDVHEELLLTVMALEAEWLLDDRIAFSLRQQ